MCRRIQCEDCQKVTFSGCGKHLDQVFRGIDPTQRCQCRVMIGVLAAPVIANDVAQLARAAHA